MPGLYPGTHPQECDDSEIQADNGFEQIRPSAEANQGHDLRLQGNLVTTYSLGCPDTHQAKLIEGALVHVLIRN